MLEEYKDGGTLHRDPCGQQGCVNGRQETDSRILAVGLRTSDAELSLRAQLAAGT